MKAVWHFDRAALDNLDFTAKLTLNPNEENVRAILPKQFFSDRHTEVIRSDYNSDAVVAAFRLLSFDRKLGISIGKGWILPRFERVG